MSVKAENGRYFARYIIAFPQPIARIITYDRDELLTCPTILRLFILFSFHVIHLMTNLDAISAMLMMRFWLSRCLPLPHLPLDTLPYSMMLATTAPIPPPQHT